MSIAMSVGKDGLILVSLGIPRYHSPDEHSLDEHPPSCTLRSNQSDNCHTRSASSRPRLRIARFRNSANRFSMMHGNHIDYFKLIS